MRWGRRDGTAAALVLATLLFVSFATVLAPALVAPIPPAAGSPEGASPHSGPIAAVVPAAERPSLGYGTLGETYVVANSTLLPGAYVNPYNVLGATLAVVDSITGFAYVGGPTLSEIGVVNTTSGHVVGTIPLPAPANAILLAPGSQDLVVAQKGTNNVSVLNLTSGTTFATFSSGMDPVALAYDPDNQVVYVAYKSSDTVGIFNWSSMRPDGVVSGVFAEPDALAVNAAGRQLFVADFGGANVTAVNTTTAVATGSQPVGSGPDALAYFAATDSVFCGNLLSQNITVRNASTGALVGTTALLFGPEQIVGDPAVGFLYVDNTTDTTIDVVNSHGGAVEGFLAGYNGAATIAVDTATDDLYVSESVTDNLTVVHAATNTILGSIRLGWSPDAVAFDTAMGALVYAAPDTSLVTFVNATTGAFLGSFPTGHDPDAVLYDPVTECAYVANYNSSSVTVINGTTLQTVGTVPVGTHPVGMALVQSYDYVFVANANGTLTIINAGTNQVVGTITVGSSAPLAGIAYAPFASGTGNESLYVTSGASVLLIGALNHTHWRTISTPQPVAAIVADTGAPTVFALSAPNASLTAGNVTVINATSGAPTTDISVPAALAGGDFDAKNGVVYIAERTAAGNLLAFNGSHATLLGTAADGVFDSAIADSAGRGAVFGVQSQTGSVSIVTLPGLGEYLVNLTETGLAAGQAWSVSFDGHSVRSVGASLSTIAPDGLLPYTVGAVTGYTASPASGNLTIAGQVTFSTVAFTRLPPKFAVNFAESGLQSGTNWSVTCNGTRENATTIDITFLLVNGSVQYSVAAVDGYSISINATGSVHIAGRPVTVNITFVAAPSTGKGTTSSSGIALGAAGGFLFAGLGALVGGVAGALVGRRGRSFAPASEAPPEEPEGVADSPPPSS